MTETVDDATVDTFRTRGVAVLRGVFRDWVDTLRRGVDINIDRPSYSGRVYRGEAGQGRFLSDYCNWRQIPQYRDFIFNSPAGAVAAQLMGSATVQLFHEHVLVKEAQSDVVTPWHQDQPYYCVEGPKTASLWVPLDEIPRETSPEFIAGSHLWGKFFRPQRFNGEPLNAKDDFEDLPDIEGNRAGYDIVGWKMAPGDAIAFDYRTVHGAPANKSAAIQRRAFSLRLVGDGARFVRREGLATSPPFPDVKLSHGAVLAGEEFPVVYTGV